MKQIIVMLVLFLSLLMSSAAYAGTVTECNDCQCCKYETCLGEDENGPFWYKCGTLECWTIPCSTGGYGSGSPQPRPWCSNCHPNAIDDPDLQVVIRPWIEPAPGNNGFDIDAGLWLTCDLTEQEWFELFHVSIP